MLELGQIMAGTYGSQVLSDLGAEVIKIEPPAGDTLKTNSDENARLLRAGLKKILDDLAM